MVATTDYTYHRPSVVCNDSVCVFIRESNEYQPFDVRCLIESRYLRTNIKLETRLLQVFVQEQHSSIVHSRSVSCSYASLCFHSICCMLQLRSASTGRFQNYKNIHCDFPIVATAKECRVCCKHTHKHLQINTNF